MPEWYIQKYLKIAILTQKNIQDLLFGFGLDRIAMLKYGITDLRLMYENDIRFLTQFK